MNVPKTDLSGLSLIFDVIEDCREKIAEREATILRWRQKALMLGGLKPGDVVEYTKSRQRYVVLDKLPDVVIKDSLSRSEDDPIEYDIRYVGLRIKQSGKLFHDSMSATSHRTELFHSYLERGVISKVDFYPDIEKRAGKYAHL